MTVGPRASTVCMCVCMHAYRSANLSELHQCSQTCTGFPLSWVSSLNGACAIAFHSFSFVNSSQGPVRWHLQYVMAPINGLLVVFLYVYWQVRNDLTWHSPPPFLPLCLCTSCFSETHTSDFNTQTRSLLWTVPFCVSWKYTTWKIRNRLSFFIRDIRFMKPLYLIVHTKRKNSSLATAVVLLFVDFSSDVRCLLLLFSGRWLKILLIAHFCSFFFLSYWILKRSKMQRSSVWTVCARWWRWKVLWLFSRSSVAASLDLSFFAHYHSSS